MSMQNTSDLFSLLGKIAIITGGGGMLGYQHAAAISCFGGMPVLLDINPHGLQKNRALLQAEFGVEVLALEVDITDLQSVQVSKIKVLECHQKIDILINNAARNPKIEDNSGINFSASRISQPSNGKWTLTSVWAVRSTAPRSMAVIWQKLGAAG